MKKLRLTLLLSTFFCSVLRRTLLPQPSPTEEIKQNSDYPISSYRTPDQGHESRVIFGDLVPYGKVWRTGANGATTITFADDVTIGDENSGR